MSSYSLNNSLTNSQFNSYTSTINDNVLLSSNQTIQGDKTFTGSTIDSNLTVNTDTVLNNLKVNGTISGSQYTSDLNAKANDNSVLHLALTETVTGDKSFSGTTKLSNVTVSGTITNTTLSNQLALLATDNMVVHLAGTESISGTKTFANATFGSTNSNTLVVNSAATFNNNITLGSTQSDTLTINATSNFGNSVSIGSSQTDTLTVKATPTFENGIINVGKSLFSNGTAANALLQYANPLSGTGTFTQIGIDGYIYTYGPTSDLNSQQMLRWSNNPNSNVVSFMGEIICTSIVSGSALQIGNGANGGGTGVISQIKSIGTSDLQCDTISINETINLMPITYITNFTADPQSQITALFNSGNALNGRITTLENDIPTLAPLNAPIFTGLPTCPTATSGSNATFQIANTQFVLEQIADLVNSSPANLSTLGQIATSLGDQTNLATVLTNSIALKADLTALTAFESTTATNLLGKQPLLSNTTALTVGAFTSNSIVDNGNLTATGNIILGNTSYTDSLTINAITTFATSPTFSGGNINTGTILQTAVNGLATSFSNKVDTTTYDNERSLLAPILSPNFSGTPQCNNCLPLAYSHTIANTNYVDSAVSVLTYLAPTNLNTFKEVAYAINNDPNYFSTVNTALATKQNTISGSTALTCGNFQSSSIVDSGNLSVSGNTIIGSSLVPTDTLQVNAITTFASPPTLNGANITGIPQAGVNGLTSSLSNKVNQSTYSTDLSIINSSLALLAPIISPSFTSIPTAPTASASTNNTQIATTAYCDNAVAVLVGSAPSYLNTLGEIATSLNDQTNLAVSLTTNIASKVSQIAYDANNTTLNASIATKQPLLTSSSSVTCGTFTSSSITDTGSCTIGGTTKIGNQTTDSCTFFTGMTISGLQMTHVTGLSSSLANIPQANVTGLSSTLATYTTLSAVQSNSNTFSNASNTFTYPPYMSGSNITASTIPQNAINGLSTTLSGYTTLSAIQANSNTFSNASNTFSNPPYMSGTNITSGTIPQSSINGLSTTLSGYTTLSAVQANSNTFSSANTFTGNLSANSLLTVMEKVIAVSISSNIATINYASGGVYYVSPSSATNFQIALTNVNPTSSTTTSCIITLLINTSTYGCYGNTCTINGTSRTIVFAGGSANVSITSGTLVQQSLSIVYSGSSTVPVVVMSSIVPFY